MAEFDSCARSLPRNRIWPAVGSIKRSTARPSVVLPQPDSPTRPSVSPGKTSSETPSTAWTTCRERRNKEPLGSEKWTFRSLTEINGRESVSIIPSRLIQQRPRSQNDRASNALTSVGHREETSGGKCPPRAHIAAQTDSPAASGPGPEAARESDRAFPARPSDPVPSARG